MEGKFDEMGFLNPCNTHENIDWHVRDVYIYFSRDHFHYRS
jgi:hypothetical protein